MTDTSLRFDGETVVVAGGGGSLGGAYARLFGARGANVIVNDVSENANQVAADIEKAGGSAFAIVGSTAEIAERVVGEAMERFGRLDVVVNSTGIVVPGLFHAIPPETWDTGFDSHWASTLNLAREAWPFLVASGNGRLINTSSTSIFGSEFTSTYIIAKGAIFAATRAWAGEGKMQNVRVNAVLPTSISQLTRSIPHRPTVEIFEREFLPEKVAGLVAYVAHRDNTLNGVAFEAGGGRASPIFLAVGEGFVTDDPETPEAWTGCENILNARNVEFLPSSMLDELQLRMHALGLVAELDPNYSWMG